jgi:hypothetical protein
MLSWADDATAPSHADQLVDPPTIDSIVDVQDADFDC